MKINQLASWWRPVELVGTPGTPGCPQIHRAVLHFKLETARKTAFPTLPHQRNTS